MSLPRIEVVRGGARGTVRIDGVELPLPFDDEGVSMTAGLHDTPAVTFTLLSDHVSVVDSRSEDDAAPRRRHGRVGFEMDAAGEWRWQVRAGNGEIVAVGEGYSREADAARGFLDAAQAMVDAIWAAS